MMPILRVLRGKAQHILHGGEEIVGEGHLVGAVHLGLHDIDRARAAVADRARPFRSCIAIIAVTAASRIGLRDVLPRLVQHRIREHVVAHVAHQHEAAPVQADLAAAGGGIDPVRVEAALDGAAALLEALHEVAPHEAEPGAVDLHLVLGVHGRDRVLQVHDGGHGRLDHQIGDARRVLRADGMGAVDPDLHMQVVVAEQNRRGVGGLAPVARELRRVGEPRLAPVPQPDDQGVALDRIGLHVPVAALGERRGAVEHLAGAGHHPGAAGLVVGSRAPRPSSSGMASVP
jgi:hypothetical protein